MRSLCKRLSWLGGSCPRCCPGAAARRRLDASIAKHPDLVGPTGPDDINYWIETQLPLDPEIVRFSMATWLAATLKLRTVTASPR